MNFRSEVFVALRERLQKPDLRHSLRKWLEGDASRLDGAHMDDIVRKLTEAVVQRFDCSGDLPHGTTNV